MREYLPLSFIATAKHAGLRLDVTLGSVFPHTGIRARRRLWDWCSICVNGTSRPPGYSVKRGDSISIEEIQVFSSSLTDPFPTSEDRKNLNYGASNSSRFSSLSSQYHKNTPSLLVSFDDFLLFYKPAEMHTATISGKKTDSLESLLPELWQSQQNVMTSDVPLPLLLTRLDYLTSGIIIAAKNKEAQKRFRQWESQGCVEKSYFCVVKGNITEPFIIKNGLDTSKRAKTRVLEGEGESTRWSRIVPLVGMDKEEVMQFPYSSWESLSYSTSEPIRENRSGVEATLVRVTIHRGARHQIRAHLAYAGYPLLGDPLYGYGQGELPFLLHHGIIVTPEFSYQIFPDWLNEV